MSTGEAGWGDRYQDAVAQQGRGELHHNCGHLAPLLYASPPALELRSADDKLLEMDAQAFALARKGDSAAAVILLNGAAYHREQQRSADAATQIAHEVDVAAESALEFQQRRGRWIVIAVAVAVSLLLFTWVISLRISAGLIARRRIEETNRADQARRSRALSPVCVMLSPPHRLRLDAMLQRCAEAIVQHLNPDLARIWVFDREQNTLVLSAGAGMDTSLEGPESWIPVESGGAIARVARLRRPHFSNAARTDPNAGDPEWLRSKAITAFAALPLIVEDRVAGVVALYARAPIEESAAAALALRPRRRLRMASRPRPRRRRDEELRAGSWSKPSASAGDLAGRQASRAPPRNWCWRATPPSNRRA